MSSGESFKEKLFHGGLWATLLNGTDRGFQLLKIAIISSILAPKSFGLLGIALLALSAAKQLSKFGLQEALIFHPENNINRYFNTVWTITAVRGFLIAGILIATAGPVSSFFREPQAMQILRVLGVAVALEGLTNPAVLYFQKELQFYKEFVYKVIGSLGDFIVAVIAAFILRNVWALVCGILVKRALQMTISHIITDHSISIGFNLDFARELFQFGRWVTVSSLVYFIVTTGDDVFAGWYLGAAALGIYQVGFRLSNSPATEISHVVGMVMFPAVSKIQDDTERVRDLFVNAWFVVAAITIPIAVGIISLSQEFASVVLGQKWAEIVPVIQVLAIGGLIRALNGLTGPIYRGLGVPKWNAYENVTRLAVLALTIWSLTDLLGATGIAVSVTLAVSAGFLVGMVKIRGLVDVSLMNTAWSFLLPSLSAAMMLPVVLYIKTPSILGIIMPIVLGATVYGLSLVSLIHFTSFDTEYIRKLLMNN